ncbi:MAG: TolC family protein [Candidatus Symbiothrix sp.]|nr:TolC family protein [Candidatus Symbiothrix sp.]
MRKIILILFWVTIIPTFVSGQETDSLSHYLEVAARNNPAVNAAFHGYEAALQKAPQMGAYDDPQLEIGFFLEPMSIVDGRQMAQFQLMQMFPWFGTKKAARTEAQHMAQMAFEQFRETRDNLYLEVYKQWYILCNLQQKLQNTKENVTLLKQLEDLALLKFTTGGRSSDMGEQMPMNNQQSTVNSSMGSMNMGSPSNPPQGGSSSGSMSKESSQSARSASPSWGAGGASGMSEILRIQLETIELESAVESILSEITAGKARFNGLLNRPSGSEVAVPDEIAQLPFLLDTENILQTIREQNPMLGMINEESLAYKAKAEMDKKMSYPMLGIGLQYMLIGKTPDTGGQSMGGMDMGAATNTMSSMNGKDMIMPMVSVSIPIFRNKYKAAQRESKLLQLSSEEKYTDTFNNLQAELYQSKHQLEDAVRKMALYKKQSALARTTYDLLVQEFASGKSALSDVIQTQRQLLDYQLKEAEATANYNTMVVSIWKLMSVCHPALDPQ